MRKYELDITSDDFLDGYYYLTMYKVDDEGERSTIAKDRDGMNPDSIYKEQGAVFMEGFISGIRALDKDARITVNHMYAKSTKDIVGRFNRLW